MMTVIFTDLFYNLFGLIALRSDAHCSYEEDWILFWVCLL